ncbi:PREDICTED: high affinity cAMP-specific and IBMX-insensitive 3',5'-cyclic phosphodiesterase 8B-like [Priapulus caudatus]|uniref:High affinity cAMP-specific and IBMX-insensitive 3',5'-cyclic phosphodiesterase 8B-like n=1 Tax=Priapulus caudatus TaxID=37621 RepID=A0ABM1DZW3_PRICU|nr:PREDICTED: high affinity cAMP-specific and IBMX-insensitive 3',5'-cyclic phosphodiesterase 8B-like [Priapulus caudatus]
MGCAPSLHVSQTGIIYCRDSDESNSHSPGHSSNVSVSASQQQPQQQQQTTVVFPKTEVTTTSDANATSIQLTQHIRFTNRRGTIEAETQTSQLLMKPQKPTIWFGPMKLKDAGIKLLTLDLPLAFEPERIKY